MTRGERFAFLPFLYDEAAAQLREANTPFVSAELAGYRAGSAPTAAADGPAQNEG